MIFILIIVAIFVAVSIYFFFKAEKLQREIILMKRETSAAKKENKAYIEVMAIIAKRNEEIVQQRFSTQRASADENNQTYDIIAPMINNYAAIFNESVKGKGKLQPSMKKVYEGHQKGTFKVLSNYINQSNKEVKRAWSSNNINGFIMLVEALMSAKN